MRFLVVLHRIQISVIRAEQEANVSRATNHGVWFGWLAIGPECSELDCEFPSVLGNLGNSSKLPDVILKGGVVVVNEHANVIYFDFICFLPLVGLRNQVVKAVQH